VPSGLISARRALAAPPATVHAFLAELANHPSLGDGRLRVHSLDERRPGGTIVLRGPLGARRRARTIVAGVRAPTGLWGSAHVGPRTLAQVRWAIESHEAGALVELSALVITAGLLDRLLLALGGRRWLRARFHETLERLARALGD
jgi:hypothetical protein